MSLEPRNSPGRRRLLAEGRGRIAVMVAGAYVVGAASGVGVPALADGPPPTPAAAACADPARTTPTAVVDGQEVDCAALQGAAAKSAAADASPSSSATSAPPSHPPNQSPDPPAAQKPAPAAAGPAPSSAAPAVKSVAPAPAAQSAAPAVKHQQPAGTPSTPAGDDSLAVAKAKAKAKLKAENKAKAKAKAKLKAVHKAKAKAQAKAKAKARAKAKAKARTRARGLAKKRGVSDAQAYAALPASWTSLQPLELPAFSVDGFPIPPFLLPIYQAAGAQYGIPWEVLASINEIESDFGRNTSVSSAGALGWMQFIYSSWSRWGTDADADGKRDPRNPVDAIFAAARYLHDAGAGTDLPKAIFAYNHAAWYVNKVVQRAREFAGLDTNLVAALTDRALREDTRLYRAHGNPFAGDGAIKPTPGQALLLTKKQLTRMALHSKDIKIYEGGRQDIAAGHVNRRVLLTLVFLARSGLKPTVSSLTTGHSLRTTSGNISAHSYGHAVDISAINGIPIIGHQGSGSITAKTLAKLVKLQGYLEPNQIISLMTIDGQDNTLSLPDHDDHIHVGFPRVPHVAHGDRPADIRKLVASFREDHVSIREKHANRRAVRPGLPSAAARAVRQTRR